MMSASQKGSKPGAGEGLVGYTYEGVDGAAYRVREAGEAKVRVGRQGDEKRGQSSLEVELVVGAEHVSPGAHVGVGGRLEGRAKRGIVGAGGSPEGFGVGGSRGGRGRWGRVGLGLGRRGARAERARGDGDATGDGGVVGAGEEVGDGPPVVVGGRRW